LELRFWKAQAASYAFALFLRTIDFAGFAIRGNFQGFQGVKKFLQKCKQLGKCKQLKGQPGKQEKGLEQEKWLGQDFDIISILILFYIILILYYLKYLPKYKRIEIC